MGPKNDEMFEDSEFEEACKELEEPQLEGWEYFTKSHETTIYRRFKETSGLYEYKIYGALREVLPEISSQVYMDIDYRKQWDTYVNELREFEADDKTLLYWNVNYPWPMSNRDYVYARSMREIDLNGKKMYVVLARSENASGAPEKDGVIRVDDYIQSCALTTDGKGGSKAYMRYYDDPKGLIPTWLINWGAKTGVPGFITMMETACRGYPQYLAQQQQQPVPS